MSDRNTRLTKEIFEAFKHLTDCLKFVYHRPQLLRANMSK